MSRPDYPELKHIDIQALIAAAGGDPWQVDASVQCGQPKQIAELAEAFRNARGYINEQFIHLGTHGPSFDGPSRDDIDTATQELLAARSNYTRERDILIDLNQANLDHGGQPVPIPALPENANVQSLPPQPSKFAEASRALSEGSLGLIPDVAKDIDVFTNWGQHSGADQTGAILDVAGSVPIPGAKFLTKGLEHGIDAATSAGRHVDDLVDDIPTGHHGSDASHAPDEPDSSPDVPTGVSLSPPQEIVGPRNETLPLVPEGAVGTPTTGQAGTGMIYEIPDGTEGLDPRVVSVRVMDPTMSGKYDYPNGYVVYYNSWDQPVNPITGRTVSASDPYRHISLP